VKKFSFALDSLRRYRHTLFEQEQSRLQSLLLELRKLEGRRLQLLEESAQARLRVRAMSVISVDQLTALQAFQRFTTEEVKRIGQAKSSLSVRIEEQKLALKLARRNVEALEKLKDRRFQAWRAEADREMEAAVAELVIGRFRRPLENGGTPVDP
jgi:flagellar export protein FliJ